MKYLKVLFAVLVFSSPGFARESPPTQYHELSLRPVLREALLLRAAVDICDAVLPETRQSETRLKLDEFLEKLPDALVGRATLLRKNSSRETLDESIGVWISAEMVEAEEMVASEAACADFDASRFGETIKVFFSQQADQSLDLYATTLPEYLSPLPAYSNDEALTFAVPSTQEVIGRHISTKLQDRNCASIKVAGVELVDSAPAGAENLPAFISEPIRYEEVWAVDCDGDIVDFSVSFIRDSDGATGVARTGLVEE